MTSANRSPKRRSADFRGEGGEEEDRGGLWGTVECDRTGAKKCANRVPRPTLNTQRTMRTSSEIPERSRDRGPSVHTSSSGGLCRSWTNSSSKPARSDSSSSSARAASGGPDAGAGDGAGEEEDEVEVVDEEDDEEVEVEEEDDAGVEEAAGVEAGEEGPNVGEDGDEGPSVATALGTRGGAEGVGAALAGVGAVVRAMAPERARPMPARRNICTSGQ